MTFGDGTQFGFSEPNGAGVIIALNGILGIPTSQTIPDLLPLGAFGAGCFGCGAFGGLYVPDLPPIRL